MLKQLLLNWKNTEVRFNIADLRLLNAERNQKSKIVNQQSKIKTFYYICRPTGIVAERLGTGLQNRILRFESGRCL